MGLYKKRKKDLLIVEVIVIVIALCAVVGICFWWFKTIKTPGIPVKAAATIKLKSKSCKLQIGANSQIKVKNVGKDATISYKPNKKKVATVSKDGKVTALTAGVAKITVSVNDSGKITTLKYMVTVKKPVAKRKKITINVGDKVSLEIKNIPKSDSNYTIELVSAKADIIGTVSGYENEDKVSGINDKMLSGNVINNIFEGKSAGTAKLKIKINVNGKTYSSTVKVTVKGFQNLNSGFDSVYSEYSGLKSLSDNGTLGVSYQDRKDTITLGMWDMEYYDGNGFTSDGKKEKMEWEVLEYSEDKKSAQVISKYIITQRPFNVQNDDVTWEDCSLRKWLNEDFYNSAFTEEEKELILTSYLRNDDTYDITYGTKYGGENTYDKLFLLSLSDIEYYYHDEMSKESFNRIARYVDGQIDYWWLRSVAGSQYSVAVIREDGYVDYSYGHTMNNDDVGIARGYVGNCGVRPTFWITLTPEIIEDNNLSIGENYHSDYDTGRYWITMGRFDVESDRNKKLWNIPLHWQILDYDKEENKLLLVSEKLITDMKYNDNSEEDNVTWENSSIRKWLNNEFYDTAFTDEEKDVIVETTLINENSAASYESSTVDKVFLLSLSEVDKYINIGNDKYAYDRICSFDDDIVSSWWLRAPFKKNQVFSAINADGLANVYFSGNYELGVRPAIWIKLK